MLCSARVHHFIHSRQSVHRIISGGSFTPIDNPSGTGVYICIMVILNLVKLMINLSYQGSVCLWKFSLVHFSKILCGIRCNFLIYIWEIYNFCLLLLLLPSSYIIPSIIRSTPTARSISTRWEIPAYFHRNHRQSIMSKSKQYWKHVSVQHSLKKFL